MMDNHDPDIFDRLRCALEDHLGVKGTRATAVAARVGISDSTLSEFRKGTRGLGKVNFDTLCHVLSLDPTTLAPVQPPPQKYDWLRRIDTRDFKHHPPSKKRKHGGIAAVFCDGAPDREHHAFTETQVQIIVALLEHRYADAMTIILEIMQGKRED